jgi:hypothetical protein
MPQDFSLTADADEAVVEAANDEIASQVPLV